MSMSDIADIEIDVDAHLCSFLLRHWDRCRCPPMFISTITWYFNPLRIFSFFPFKPFPYLVTQTITVSTDIPALMCQGDVDVVPRSRYFQSVRCQHMCRNISDSRLVGHRYLTYLYHPLLLLKPYGVALFLCMSLCYKALQHLLTPRAMNTRLP